MKRKFIERPFTIKSIETDGTFTGHASIFGEMDSYRDIVLPGAFQKSLQEDFIAKGRKVPMLWQHDPKSPIGVYTEIKEDKIGLYVEGQCNMDVQKGREAHSLMKQGALSGLSIGYDTVISEWDEKAITRKLMEVSLWEVSPVTFPAGDGARVSSVKSIGLMENLSDVEDYLREEGFSKSESLALVARIKAIASRRDSASAEPAVTKALQILKSLP